MPPIFLSITLLASTLFFIVSLAVAQVPPRDALGVRVFKNPEGLSAADWYRDQCKGATKAFLKCGTPTPIIVDGYDGVKDGNTVYVNAANKGSDGKIYTNIYLLAVAEGGSTAGSAVFDQILANWKFPTATQKLSSDDAAKLRRDVRRHAQLTSLRRFLDSYKSAKRCSFTRTQLCSDTNPCSQGQTCGNYLPTLASGTYIPKVSFSTWPSWQQTLGQALGSTLPTDSGRPYLLPDPNDASKLSWQWKHFIGCGNPYDPDTCWDARKATMACPLQAYAFAYRYSEQNQNPAYTLTTTYESATIPDSWRGEIHDPRSWAGSLCTAIAGDTLDADRDADGVKDRFDNCPEDPNPILQGQTKQTDSDNDGKGDACDWVMRKINGQDAKIFCPLDDRNDIDKDGICGNVDTCPFVVDTGRLVNGIDEACSSSYCGNSSVNKFVGEDCDTIGGKGTSATDQYSCGAPGSGNDCKWQGGWCGDKEVNGTEQCDGRGGHGSSDTDQYECGAATPRTSTSCRFVGGWCGDRIKNDPEPCDVNDQTKAGLQANQICIKTDGGTCEVQQRTYCGDGVEQNSEECVQMSAVTWKQESQASWPARYGHTAVVFNNKIWVMGGYNISVGYLNDVWSSSDGKNWSQEPQASWPARYLHAAVVFNNKIWVMGGYKTNNYWNDVWHIP